MKPNHTQPSLIELEHVGKVYNGVAVLEEVSMSIKAGSATAILGRNGSGKSTLLSILAGLIQINSGRLYRKNKAMKIGYAPEIFPGLKFTPEEFLRSVGSLHGLNSLEIDHRMTELLACFRLESFGKRPMESFSKGMLQKVNLMQSMLIRPPLLLLDEPMSGLDTPAQDTLLELVHGMKREGTAIVFSVHDPLWIEELADDVHVLKAGRKLRSINRSELHSSSYSKIGFKGIPVDNHTQLELMTGYISLILTNEQMGIDYNSESNDTAMITVQSALSDSFLRSILDAGGSILSVERIGGLTGLELGLTLKDDRKRGAE